MDVVSRLVGSWRPRRVLDAGCGIGIFTEFWAQTAPASLHACDLSREATEVTQGRCPAAQVTQSLLSRLPYADGAFDTVHCFDVLYHITDDQDWRMAVSELCRVTAPGGRLLILEAWKRRGTSPAPHVKFRSIAEYAVVLERWGVEAREAIPLYLVLSRNYLATRFLPLLSLGMESLLDLGIAARWAGAHIVMLQKGTRSAG